MTRAALDNARHGQGPTLIEAYTYRMGAHTTSDDPTRYRIAGEVEAWQAKDPIARVRAFLDAQGIADDGFFAAVDEQAAAGGGCTLRERVLVDARPGPVRCSTTSTPTARRSSTQQREQFARYLDSFEGSAH